MTTEFDLLGQQLKALVSGETDTLANAANFVALIHDALADVNWTGIYLLRATDLVLGPFQGKPACTRIALGNGVCGTAAKSRETQRVADVHEFAGHIACDPDSRSELVVPLLVGQRLLGVLDIDSPERSRFSAADQSGVESLCKTFIETQDEGRLLSLID